MIMRLYGTGVDTAIDLSITLAKAKEYQDKVLCLLGCQLGLCGAIMRRYKVVAVRLGIK
jgi:hypothetical protein